MPGKSWNMSGLHIALVSQNQVTHFTWRFGNVHLTSGTLGVNEKLRVQKHLRPVQYASKRSSHSPGILTFNVWKRLVQVLASAILSTHISCNMYFVASCHQQGVKIKEMWSLRWPPPISLLEVPSMWFLRRTSEGTLKTTLIQRGSSWKHLKTL